MVSAIIITHNRCNLLQRAITSVKNQTYDNIEIIVVDDASEDLTESVMRITEGINYIRISKKESKGGNHARNIGIAAANGEYIAFLDDDDEWYPEKIQKQLDAFTSEKIGMVYCDLHVDVGIKALNYDHAYFWEGDLYKEHQYWKAICTTSAMVIRKDVFNRIGVFDENVRYWQEYELSLRIVEQYEIGLVKESLVLYRREIGDKKKLTNNYDNWEEAVEYIRRKHKRLFDELPPEYMKKHQEMYLSEAAYRCSAVGEMEKMRAFYKSAYELTGKKEYEIRWILGISRQMTSYLEPIIKKIIYKRNRKWMKSNTMK